MSRLQGMSRLLSAAIFLALFAAGPALADAAGVVLAKPNVDLTLADDGTAAGTLSLLNVTSSTLQVRLELVTAPPGCSVTPSTADLSAARQHDVSLTVTGCHLAQGDGVKLRVSPAGQAPFELAASVPASPGVPPWSWLGWSFGLAAAAAVVVVGAAWSHWDGGGTTRTWRTPLPGLKPDYDFGKSWVSSATLVASAFAAVFGAADVRKAILGAEDASTGAVILVAAAIAAGLIVAGPLVTTTFRSGKLVTSGGLVGASVITALGTGGQLGVLLATAWHLDIGRFRWVAVGLGAAAVLLLGTYVFRSLTESLTSGLEPPTPTLIAPPSPSRDVVEALIASDVDNYDALTAVYPSILVTSPGDGPRTAIL